MIEQHDTTFDDTCQPPKTVMIVMSSTDNHRYKEGKVFIQHYSDFFSNTIKSHLEA